jgi:large subunit ribosomal protein L23
MTFIIKRPVVTEKMTALADERQYAFEVSKDANKIEIAKTIEVKYKVTVTSVRTVVVKGKSKLQMNKRGRFEGNTRGWKKAIVTLKEGDKIELVESA